MEYELSERQRQLVFAAISHFEDFLTEEMNSSEANPQFRPGREAEISEIQQLYPIFRRKKTTVCPSCGEALWSNQEYWTCFACDACFSFEEVSGEGEK